MFLGLVLGSRIHASAFYTRLICLSRTCATNRSVWTPFVNRLYDEKRALQYDSREARKELREIVFWDVAPDNQVRKSGRGRGRRYQIEVVEQELRENNGRIISEGGDTRSR